MLRRTALLSLLIGVLLAVLGAPGNAQTAPQAETLTYGRFGTVKIYRRTPHPAHVVLFLSGDGGWNKGVVDMARVLTGMDALVAGIDLPHYLKQVAGAQEKCTYAAADLELLSKYLQKKLGLPVYTPPVLVGYSSGATLVYGALVQAPPGTFRGAVSMGFCPDLPLRRPFCEGHGLRSSPRADGKGYDFLPVQTLENPWVAFQGEHDKVCSKDFSLRYTRGVRGAEAVLLPDVGHGFSRQDRWVPQFRQAFHKIVQAAPPPAAGVKDLPLVEVPARQAGDAMAVILSGDGGWAGLDKDVAGALSARGVPVAGLDSLRYFWTSRTPDILARDLERVLRHYLAAWNRREALLIGYSFGAEVLPFAASRLPADLLNRVRLVTLIAPGPSASFEFHLTDWLGGGGQGQPVLPEVKKLGGRSLLCLYGKDEDDSLCPRIGPPLGRAVALPGGHHFGGRYDTIADVILKQANIVGR
jgi:type IV secretory pathway VirJ component